MRFKIFQLTNPDFLTKHVPDGYHMRQINRMILQEPEYSLIDTTHDSFESAEKELDKHGKELSYETFVILPVIRYNHEGDKY